MERAEFQGVPGDPKNHATELNNDASTVFEKSNDPKKLSKALAWADLALKYANADQEAGVLDTKANLLYKLGKKKEALELEKIAVDKAPADEVNAANYKKMQAGQPTW